MSTQHINDTLIEWLQEAHAMARHGETMLDGRAARLDDYPELQSRLKQHVEETAENRRRIEGCLKQLDAESSTAKDIGGKLSALGHSWGTAMAGEEAVQSNTASLAFEHFEIANYRALAVVAEMAGQHEIKQACEQMMAGEQAMAKWLDDHVIDTTRRYLERVARRD